jgi:hypothetical protein
VLKVWEWRNLDFIDSILFFMLIICHQQLSGAAEARRAHNPEGNGSKPFSAITFVFAWYIKHLSFTLDTRESRSETHRSQKAF